MNILITGALGCIGLECIRALESSYHIVALDRKSIDSIRKSYGYHDTMFLSQPHIEIIQGDICDRKLLQAIFKRKKFHCVLHFCAISSVGEAEKNPLECRRVNVKGTQILLEIMQDSPSRNASLIFTSSREVYGDTKGIKISEDAPMQPINVYGKSKLESQILIENYAKTRHNHCVILCLSNVYGSIFDKPSRVIPNFSAKLQNDEAVHIYGGNQILDFVYIDDVVGCIKKALSILSFRAICEHFIIASSKAVELKMLLILLEKIYKKKAICHYEESRIFEVANFQAYNTKASQFFAMQFMGIEEGLVHYARKIHTQKEAVC